MPIAGTDLQTFVAEQLVARNAPSRALFSREADRLARACETMAGRFLRGGRLIAFGRGPSATDAQHVAVEFVHPVIVGKRALPALDVSAAFAAWLPAIIGADDIAMGFSAPAGDPEVAAALAIARSRGAQTFALPGLGSDFSIEPPSDDPFVSQELIEVLYHTLWETVHVFFEHGPSSAATTARRPAGAGHDRIGALGPTRGGIDDLGASGFLYPFLVAAPQDTSSVVGQVAASIAAKAADDERLREEAARDQSAAIAGAIAAVHERLRAGAMLLMFGNGGSATDANDWAIDCVEAGGIRAVSLGMEPATITAVANDVGTETIFLRQLIAHGRRGDVAIAISTSGGSANVIAALDEARRRQMLTVALLGYDGGEIARRGLADLPVVVRSDYIPRIQEVQASIYHVMTEAWRRWT